MQDSANPLQTRTSPAARIVTGLAIGALACIVALYGSIRLGMGRHGGAWWRPFENELTPAHVENLVVFALGLAGIAIGAWLVASAVVRARRAR